MTENFLSEVPTHILQFVVGNLVFAREEATERALTGTSLGMANDYALSWLLLPVFEAELARRT